MTWLADTLDAYGHQLALGLCGLALIAFGLCLKRRPACPPPPPARTVAELWAARKEGRAA